MSRGWCCSLIAKISDRTYLNGLPNLTSLFRRLVQAIPGQTILNQPAHNFTIQTMKSAISLKVSSTQSTLRFRGSG